MTRCVTMVSDDVNGGAAIACRRLTTALQQDRVCDVSWVASKSRGMDGVISASDWPAVVDTLVYRMASRFSRHEPFLRLLVDRIGNRSVYTAVRRKSPRLVHLHGLHEGLSFDLVARLAARYPLVWTLHDMWPLTGYCYYSYTCEKYLLGCKGECPQMGKCGAAVRSPAQEWGRRDRVYHEARERLVLVAPSRWMARCAEQRFGGTVRVEHIAYGVDLKVFKQVGARPQVRALLGLPVDRPIILTGAALLGESRKGTASLPEIIAQIQREFCISPLLVALGGAEKMDFPKGDMLRVGIIQDEALLNLYYNAADVFVLPTKADNLPNMLLEAVSAGTPCVATDVGGCGDVVVDGKTGFLVAPANSEGFVQAISRILCAIQGERNALSGQCRAHAEQAFDSRRQAARYLALYREMTDTDPSPFTELTTCQPT